MRLLICCLALVCTTVINAQTISNEMKADITSLLNKTGALKIGDQMGNVVSQQIIAAVKTQNPNLPASTTEMIIDVVRENINSFINSEETIAGLVNIYAQHYTHDEIKTLMEFYDTPLGEKLIQISPQIAQESAQFGQKLFLQRVPQIQKDIGDRMKAAGLEQKPQAQPQPE